MMEAVVTCAGKERGPIEMDKDDVVCPLGNDGRDLIGRGDKAQMQKAVSERYSQNTEDFRRDGGSSQAIVACELTSVKLITPL